MEITLEFGVPQGSVLAPRGYSMHTQPLVGPMLNKHTMIYTDDAQGYILSSSLRTTGLLHGHLSPAVVAYVSEVSDWMSANLRKLN